jgi:formate dehydrogenase iron-sulfur subunit
MKLDGASSLTIFGPPEATWVREKTSFDLIADLLLEQTDLTAVDRFAQFHDDAQAPLQGRYYSALIPATPPGPGQQYGFEVDLDRCSGCKACVSACHSMNGLDEGEAWRDVGMLIGGTFSLPVIQHVTSACHHCLDPACLTACPVDAYEKDPITGIVKHLDDQCFGCQYCTLACPYDVPQFHSGKGIVRKCDLCSDRLSAGEAPACVQACPHAAIRIRIVDNADVIARADRDEFLPCAPLPRATRPSTVYRSARPLDTSSFRPADEERLAPEHAHKPLIAMLVLTQLSVGGFVVELLARLLMPGADLGVPGLGLVSLAVGLAGLAASLLHLGRPLFAYRALLGIGHSWLSREVTAFAFFATFATAHVIVQHAFSGDFPRTLLLGLTVLSGVIGVGTSVMVYHVVRRPFWAAAIGGTKFAGTTLVLGLATALACLGVASAHESARAGSVAATAICLMIASTAKLAYEARLKRTVLASRDSPLRKSALLMAGALKRPAGWRVFHGIVGGIVLPMVAMAGALAPAQGILIAAAVLSLPMALAAELTERFLFFTAVVKPKMPGGR